MRPKERRESGKQDLFRARLDQIIDLEHALRKLAHAIDWRFLEEKFGAVYTDKPGHPPLPTRLIASSTPYGITGTRCQLSNRAS
jgi:transposase, IS5 family